MPLQNDKLDELLNEWQPEFKPDPQLARTVKQQLEVQRIPKAWPASWLVFLAGRPVYAGFAVLALVLFGASVSYYWNAGSRLSESEYVGIYRLSIDPVFRMQTSAISERRVAEQAMATGVPLEASLVWLENELRLDVDQSERFAHLHESYRNDFNELFAELVTLRRGYDEFDNHRKTNDVIDFIALYELIQKQKALRQRSEELTEELISRTSEILNASQRKRFAELVLQGARSDTEVSQPGSNA